MERFDDPIWTTALHPTPPVAIDAHVDGCRWPIGAPETRLLYCNAPTKAGSAYCPEHHAIAWRPRQPAAR